MADHDDAILNARCRLELRHFEARPIEGVRYMGLTTRLIGSESLIVLNMDIKKYGLTLRAVLPKRYPEEKPRLVFDCNIPRHPIVNPDSGEICCVWPTKDEQWSPSVKIRDVVAQIMDVLAAAEIPVVTKSRKELKDGRSERFPLSLREFHHFLGEGAKFVADLKIRLRCQAKYLGMGKKEKQKDPHFGITGEPLAKRLMMAELDEYLVWRRFRRTVTYSRPIANDGEDKEELQDVAGASVKQSYRYSSDVFPSPAALPSSCTRAECTFPAPPNPFHGQFDASFDNSVATRSASSVLHHQLAAPTCTSHFSTDDITCTEPLYDETVNEAIAEFMVPPSCEDKFCAANLIDFGNEQSDNAADTDERGLIEASAIAGPDQPAIDEMDQMEVRPVRPDFLAREFITQSEANEIAISTEDSNLEDQFNSGLMAAIAEEARQAAAAALASSIDDYVELELPPSLQTIALAELSSDDIDEIIKQTKQCVLEITPVYYRIVLALNRRVDIMERKLKELCDRIPLAIIETGMAKKDFARRRQELVRGQQEMERFRCAMCMRRLVNTALTCGHVLCGQCVDALRATGNRCPLCHQMSDDVLQLY